MKKFFNLTTLYFAAAVIALGAFFIPFAVDQYNLRTQGIHYFTDDMENYHNNAHPIEDVYTIDIDLTDLESNKEKVLFDDGENQIYVSKVIAHQSNEYELFFKSSGNFSTDGATIVSGVEHKHTLDGLQSTFQAEAEAAYSGDTYPLSPLDYSGLSYSETDEFAFHLKLPDEVLSDIEEEGIIEVAVANLYLTIWAKK
ncbi:hypothetical protein [Jeotgalibacillus campisalis]|uniref:Uncharacterized protein n=1 Tax=Jeotgalibacillus campisalis TaxID=220754 RepID=A0A0C2RR13_9BACL|nr:hypothetical protein [Jeotgalibacillus campisalis]KIL52705.1 hypothetical protein KR50_00340 [Jeotgalibacillus campisalis]